MSTSLPCVFALLCSRSGKIPSRIPPPFLSPLAGLPDAADIPLALVVDGANRHDMKLRTETSLVEESNAKKNIQRYRAFFVSVRPSTAYSETAK